MEAHDNQRRGAPKGAIPAGGDPNPPTPGACARAPKLGPVENEVPEAEPNPPADCPKPPELAPKGDADGAAPPKTGPPPSTEGDPNPPGEEKPVERAGLPKPAGATGEGESPNTLGSRLYFFAS